MLLLADTEAHSRLALGEHSDSAQRLCVDYGPQPGIRFGQPAVSPEAALLGQPCL